jgi:hypothetical protein
MNERIKLLAKQAEIDYDLRPEIARAPVWIGTDEELAKFAELIVAECADLCNKFGDRLEDERPNKDLDIVAYECADGLKRHFGVKE